MELFKGPKRRTNPLPDVNYKIDDFMKSFLSAVEALYVLRLYMYSSTRLSTAQCANFDLLAQYLVGLFRSDPRLKRSMLESHLPSQLVQFGGCVSQFLEEDIERERRICGMLDSQYNLITGWVPREKAIMASLQRAELPSTKQFRAGTEARTKRTFSEESTERIDTKRGEVVNNKQERMSLVMLRVNEEREGML